MENKEINVQIEQLKKEENEAYEKWLKLREDVSEKTAEVRNTFEPALEEISDIITTIDEKESIPEALKQKLYSDAVKGFDSLNEDFSTHINHIMNTQEALVEKYKVRVNELSAQIYSLQQKKAELSKEGE